MCSLAIVTTITRPDESQYPWREALNCYLDIADEVVVVYGDRKDKELLKDYETNPKLKTVYHYWPEEWDWSELPKHINTGFNHISIGIDWGCKMDIDYLFHEDGIAELKEKLQIALDSKYRLCEVLKHNILNKGKGYARAIVPIFVNMHYWHETEFGKAIDKDTDWCFPIYRNNKRAIAPKGSWLIGVPVYNYDSFFRTKEVERQVFWRFAKAYYRAFGEWRFGKDPDDAMKNFMGQMRKRVHSGILFKVRHPKWIKDRVEKITEEQFGFNNWNL